MRLSSATAALLPAEVARITRRPTSSPKRIVHLGVGAFHRAHQAVYTEEAVEAGGEDWRITGVSLRSADTRDALASQDWWYTVTERANGASQVRAISTLERVIVAPEDPQAVLDALAAPETHVVTLTVTEKGYHRVPATGRLDLDATDIRAELAGTGPRTIFGFLAAGLALRQDYGAGGLTLISCDNLPANGRLLGALLSEFVQVFDPELGPWLEAHVRCPDSMVDRIVPASTPKQCAEVAATLCMTDAGAIVTEPFRQWVIEDRFAGPRPRWEAAGVQIVADVRPFERAKLRLLNAAHSALAYAGIALGYTFVHEAIADSDLRAFVVGLLDEAAPTLLPAEGLSPEDYINAIIARFANADLRHSLRQIATDGSQKLPQRWFATMSERATDGLSSPYHCAATAIWLDYIGESDAAPDLVAAKLTALRHGTGRNAPFPVGAMMTQLGVVPLLPADDRTMIGEIEEALNEWHVSPNVLFEALRNRREENRGADAREHTG